MKAGGKSRLTRKREFAEESRPRHPRPPTEQMKTARGEPDFKKILMPLVSEDSTGETLRGLFYDRVSLKLQLALNLV